MNNWEKRVRPVFLTPDERLLVKVYFGGIASFLAVYVTSPAHFKPRLRQDGSVQRQNVDSVGKDDDRHNDVADAHASR